MSQILNIPFPFQSNKYNAKCNNWMLIITLLFWVQFICTSHFDTLFIALKGKQKRASKPNREGPRNHFSGKRKHKKVCRRDTSASSYFFSLSNGSVVVEGNAKNQVLNFNKNYVAIHT